MADPVRLRILDHLKARFLAIQEGVDDHVLTWNVVVVGVLDDIDETMGNALAIMEGNEVKNEEIGFVRCDLRIATEFSLRTELGENNSQAANLVMADIYRTMRSDVHATVSTSPLCELTIDMREVSNDLDLENTSDRGFVSGVVVWSILYRHQINDPTKLFGE